MIQKNERRSNAQEKALDGFLQHQENLSMYSSEIPFPDPVTHLHIL
jgi:hypothetical protein